MKYRIYLIGYDPPELPFSKELAVRLIAQSDVCAEVAGPVPIGAEFTTRVEFRGQGPVPARSMVLRCTAHEHFGKVILAEEISQ